MLDDRIQDLGPKENSKHIPLSKPWLTSLEEQFVSRAVSSGFVSSFGEFLDGFADAFQRDHGLQNVLPVSNGTVALDLALTALGIGPSDEVIIPSLAYVAVANAVARVGAQPVFADIESSTWGLSPDSVLRCITHRTKALIVVHNYGHPADMSRLAGIAERHRLTLIEDCAEALFASCSDQMVGTFGDAATFSFYGNKVLTCGEGGAVAFRDEAVAARARLLRGQGMDPNRKYFFPVRGFNFRMSNLSAALLCAQLSRKDEILAERFRVFARYRDRLSHEKGLSLQEPAPWARISPWQFSVLVEGVSSTTVQSSLGNRGIETRPLFFPVSDLPMYRRAPRDDLPVTKSFFARGLSLPTFPEMTNEQVDSVARELLSSVAALK